jgi:hypothetical protein
MNIRQFPRSATFCLMTIAFDAENKKKSCRGEKPSLPLKVNEEMLEERSLRGLRSIERTIGQCGTLAGSKSWLEGLSGTARR